VGGIKIGDGPAIGDHQVFETPFVAEDALQQAGAAAAGFIVQTLVGAHDLSHIGFLHQGLERRQVGFVEFAGTHLVEVELVTAPFGA